MHAKTRIGSIFIPEKYVIRVLFVCPWMSLIPPLAPPPPGVCAWILLLTTWFLGPWSLSWVDSCFKLLFVFYWCNWFWELIPANNCSWQKWLFVAVFGSLYWSEVICSRWGKSLVDRWTGCRMDHAGWQGFFSKFLMGGTQNFWSPHGGGGGNLRKKSDWSQKCPLNAKLGHFLLF